MRKKMPAFRKFVWLRAGALSVSIFRSCPSICTGFPRYSVTRTGTPLTSGIVPEIVTVAEMRRPPTSISARSLVRLVIVPSSVIRHSVAVNSWLSEQVGASRSRSSAIALRHDATSRQAPTVQNRANAANAARPVSGLFIHTG